MGPSSSSPPSPPSKVPGLAGPEHPIKAIASSKAIKNSIIFFITKPLRLLLFQKHTFLYLWRLAPFSICGLFYFLKSILATGALRRLKDWRHRT
jgi:hypothetical protein